MQSFLLVNTSLASRMQWKINIFFFKPSLFAIASMSKVIDLSYCLLIKENTHHFLTFVLLFYVIKECC